MEVRFFLNHILGLRNWWYIISNLAQRKIGRMATKWCPRSKSQSWGPHNSNFTLVYAITVVYDTQITSNNYMVLYYTLDLIRVGGAITILKNISSSMGLELNPIYYGKKLFQTKKQLTSFHGVNRNH